MQEPSEGVTPLDKNPLRLTKVKKTAAGIPAAISSLNHGIRKMGVTKTIKTLLMVNQKDGFDCPGCAWPDPNHRTSFEFCENGAKAVADEAMKEKVNPNFFKKYDVNTLLKKSDFWLNKQGRLSHPMILKNGNSHYEPISWSDAFDLISESIESMNNPARGVYYTSGRTSNEAAFLYQALVRSLGTNNMPDCSNMCHESSGKALGATIGIGKGTVHLEDFNESDLIIVVGQNPGTNHPRMLTALRDAKRNGSKIVNINPLPETGLSRFKHPQEYIAMDLTSTQLADMHLQVKIGGDAALFQGVIKHLLDTNNFNSNFIDTHTIQFTELKSHMEQFSWDRAIEDSGLSKQQIIQFAELCSKSQATIACWAMGLTQHKNGVAVIQEVVNLLLLGGHIGKPGAGVCPVRGHSNVQGDRTVGIWEAPSSKFLETMERGLGFNLPKEHGYDVVESIRAMEKGDVDVFICMGGNFLSATPDTKRTAKAIKKINLTVQISTKLNRSHLITGETALILPVLGRTEIDLQNSKKQFVTVENSMGVVHRSEGKLAPTSQSLMSEPAIVSELGHRLVPSNLPWKALSNDYDTIRDLMSVSLQGFEEYNERVRQENGFLLSNRPRDDLKFETPSGKAVFSINPLSDVSVKENQFVLMTMRSHDQYNTTIYGLHDRYRGIHGNRRVVLMNALDMAQHGLKTRDIIDLESHFQGTTRQSKNWIVIAYDIPKGNMAAYFPEANELVPLDSVADKSNTPTSKWIVVTMSNSNDKSEEE